MPPFFHSPCPNPHRLAVAYGFTCLLPNTPRFGCSSRLIAVLLLRERQRVQQLSSR
jgi:hypothetical protein